MYMDNNYLFYNRQFPAHFSIGAVVLDKDNKIMCHHYKEIDPFSEIYVLMRETPEKNESVEKTLKRGLMEEFGATAGIVHYLGSIVSHHNTDNIENLEKTTLYFQCQLEDFSPENRFKDDPEAGSEILFLPKEELVEKMKSQAERYPERTDLDERKILNKIKY